MESNFVKVSDSGFRAYDVDLKRNRAAGYMSYLSQNNGAHSSALKSSLNLGKRKKPDSCITTCKTCRHPPQKSLSRCYMNFMKSGLPERVMFYQNEGWVDHGSEIIDIVRKEFEFKKAAVEVKLNDLHLVFDFVRMFQFNFITALELPIAWIDEYGSCFFPEVYTDVDEQQNEEESPPSTEDGVQEIKLQIEIEVNGVGDNKVLEYCGETSPLLKRIKICQNAEVDEGVGENQHSEINLNSVAEKETSNMDEETVREMFLDGMSRYDFVSVVGIGSNSGSMWQGRLELFMKQTEITEKIRGNANVCYAWLGSTKEASSGIVAHGLGHFGLKQIKSAYGIGVHLVPANCANTSAKYCDVDENGVRYMVLCRVIMGNMEMVHAGSKQFHPSNENFDSGVDDLRNPRHYVVWSMNINTHIYPEYVVSFKVPTNSEGNQHETLRVKPVHENTYNSLKVGVAIDMVGDHQSNVTLDGSMERTASMNSTTIRVPKSPWMPFPILLAGISKQVPSKDMKAVLVHYERFRKKMISRENFVKHLRLIVGDTILKTTLIELNSKINPKNGTLMRTQNEEIAG